MFQMTLDHWISMYEDNNNMYNEQAFFNNVRRLDDLSDEITVKIDEELAKQTTSEVVVYSFKIFGSMFAGVFILFLFLRTKFPLVYTYNTVVPEQRTPLSENAHGWFNWIYKIFQHSDEEIFENCGMTAIIYLRFLRIGVKLSCVGIFNSFFLFPVNMYGCADIGAVNETWTNEQRIAEGFDACTTLVDKINKISLGNVSASNQRLLATTLAAYFMFGTAISLIFKEFKWFTEMRHKFLVKRRPDNYTVYVSHIPKEYRSDVALLEYFRSVFSHEDVLEAKIAVDTHNLEKKIAKRLEVVGKLEHAINIKTVKGIEPNHLNLKGKMVQSIPTYGKELMKLNEKISSVIDEIIAAKSTEKKKFLRDMVLVNDIESCFSDLTIDREDHILRRGPIGSLYHGSGRRKLDVTTDDNDNEDGKTFLGERISTRSVDPESDALHDTSGTSNEVDAVTILNSQEGPSLRSNGDLYLNKPVLWEQPIIEAKASDDDDDDEILPCLPSEMRVFDLKQDQQSSLDDAHPLLVRNDTTANISNSDIRGHGLALSDQGFSSPTIKSSHDIKIELASPKSESNKASRRKSFHFGSASSRASPLQGDLRSSKSRRSFTRGPVSNSLGQITMKTVDSARKVGNIVGKGGKAVSDNVFKAGHHLADGFHIVGKGIQFGGRYVGQRASNTIRDIAVGGAYYATKAQKRVTKLLVNSPDGTVLDSGFVTFSNLSAKNQCVQMLHHATPFSFLVKHAPLPKDIFWKNVGMPHKEQQIGFVIAQALTVGLFILITIPVAFFTSLSETDNLQEVIPALEKAIIRYPWLPTFLAQLSPVLLVALTAILPFVLRFISRYEGHVATTELNASLLAKLSVFMIIQVFFVQALSGSIFQQLELIINKPNQIINLLATSVPNQVKSFIQFVLIQNFLGCSVEILRVIPIGLAIGHNRLAPALTEKERRTPYLFFKPLTYPEEIEYPLLFSEMILYFLVTLIYSCVAPIMPYFILVTFGILSVVFRHQLIYVYSPENDDGGKMWSKVIMVLIICLFLAEFTLTGILSLKQGVVAATLMIPLIIISGLCFLYITQQHFRVTEFIPSTLSKKYDIRNFGRDNSFLNQQYLQPSLKTKTLLPENMSLDIKRQISETLNPSSHMNDDSSLECNSYRNVSEDANKSDSVFDSQRLLSISEDECIEKSSRSLVTDFENDTGKSNSGFVFSFTEP